MKQTLLSFLFLTAFACFNIGIVVAQDCPPTIAGSPIGPDNSTFCVGVSAAADIAATSIPTPDETGATDYTFVITELANVDELGDPIIFGLAPDGSFDLNKAGAYEANGFAFNQAEIDAVGEFLNANPALAGVVGIPAEALPLPAPLPLASLFDIAQTLIGDLTVPGVLGALGTLTALLPTNLCFAVVDTPYDLTATDDASLCQTVVECVATAGTPVGPLDPFFCIGQSPIGDIAASSIPATEVTTTTDYTFVVAELNNLDPDGIPIILGLTPSGGIDLPNAGDYEVFGFAYNQSEIDGVAEFLNANPALVPLLGLPAEALPLPTPLPLASLFDIAKALIGDLTVPGVLGALTTLNAVLPTPLCLAVAEIPYTVTAQVCGTPSIVGDECTDPITLEGFPTETGVTFFYGPYENTELTVNENDPLPGCFAEGTLESTMWFSFVGDGNVYDIKTSEVCAGGLNLSEFDLYITDGDTQMAAYAGDNCGSLAEITCNEDAGGATTGNFFSELKIETEAGVTYYLMVDGYDNTGSPSLGQFCFAVSLGEACTAFVELAPDTPTTLEICSDEMAVFNIDINSLDFGPTESNGIVWNILGIDPMGQNPNTLAPEFDLGLFIGHPFAGDFEVPGDGSGDTIWVVGIIGSLDTEAGQVGFDACFDFTEAVRIINIPDGQGDCPVPVDCSNSNIDLLPGIPTTISTCDSTILFIDDATLAYGADIGINPTVGWLVVSIDPETGGDALNLALNGDPSFIGIIEGLGLTLTNQGIADTLWVVAVNFPDIDDDGFALGDCLVFTEVVQVIFLDPTIDDCAPPIGPVGDDCSDPLTLDGFPTEEGVTFFYGPYDNTEFTVSATDLIPDCFFENNPASGSPNTLDNTIWFSFVGDGNVYDILTTDECNGGINLSDFDLYITNGDTQMALYTGDDCGSLTEIACNEDATAADTGNFFSELSIETEAGVTYYIMVDGYNDAGAPSLGNFCFAVSLGQACTAFVELVPDTPTTFEICSDETAIFNIDTNTLDFGPTDANGIVWNILAVDPMEENPNNIISDLDLGLFLGHPFAGDFEVSGDGSGDTIWVVGIIGALDTEAGQVNFDACFDFTEAIRIINIPDGQGDCPDPIPCEVVVELVPNTPTEFNICSTDSAVFNIDSNTLSFAGSDANSIVWNVFLTDPGNDPFGVPDSLDLGYFSGHPNAGDFDVNWRENNATIWVVAIPGIIDFNANTVGFDNCIAFSPVIQINSLAIDDPACVVTVVPLITTEVTVEGGPDEYAVAFSISGGTAPYFVDGVEIAGADFTQNVACGATYNFVVSDADGTTLAAIDGTTPNCLADTLFTTDVTIEGGPDEYAVAFSISGGTTPYFIDGVEIAGADFTQNIACGTAYSFVVSDTDGTTLATIDGTTPGCAETTPPVFSEGENGEFIVSFTISGGRSPYFVNDEEIEGDTFTATVLCGTDYNFVISDAANIVLTTLEGQTPSCPEPLAVSEAVVDGGPNAFTVSFTISGGATPYAVNGNEIAGTNFTGTVDCGSNYNFVVSDADGTTLGAITGTTDDCPPPSCNVDAGSISTVDGATAVSICVSDNVDDSFDITAVLGTVGNESGYVITEAATGTVLATAPANQISFNLAVAGAGVCNIYRYEADTEIEPFSGVDVTNLSDITGCFDLSAPITVSRNEVVVNLNVDCDPQNGQVLASVSVTGTGSSYILAGDFAGEIFAGENLALGTFTDGSTINLTATDESTGCSASVSQPVACTKCENNAGTVIGAPNGGTLFVCDGSVATVNVNNAQIDEDYALYFQVTDASGNTLDILDDNGDFIENFDISGFNTNEMITISTVIGGVDGIDPSDPCTITSSNSVGVVFLAPVTVTIDINCDRPTEIATYTIGATGGLPGFLSDATYTITGTGFGNSITIGVNEDIPTQLANGENYTFTATDQLGCSISRNGTVDCLKNPVTWLPFTGEVIAVGNLLTWGTASESKNDYFEVTRSLDGTNYEVIGTVKAQNASFGASYSFLDKTAPIGRAYYTLTQTDFNGVNSLHPDIVTLTRGETGFVLGGITPVPAQNYIEIGFTSDQASAVIMNIHDITGRLVGTQNGRATAGANALTIDVSNYASGVYFISMTNNVKTLTSRFIKE